jgi:hypothetical protein
VANPVPISRGILLRLIAAYFVLTIAVISAGVICRVTRLELIASGLEVRAKAQRAEGHPRPSNYLRQQPLETNQALLARLTPPRASPATGNTSVGTPTEKSGRYFGHGNVRPAGYCRSRGNPVPSM